MLTNGKIARSRFTSAEDGNPFRALAAEVARADQARAAGLRRTAGARRANAARKAGA